MALTDAQIAKLERNRKASPPGYYKASTRTKNALSGDTEDAIILCSAEARQKASAYFDALASTNPATDDPDTITARAAKRQRDNIDAALGELEPILQNFETFRSSLTDSNSAESIFALGMQPLMQSINGGVAATRLRVESLRFMRKFSIFAEAKYGGSVTSDQRKEWRSWKRILVSYP